MSINLEKYDFDIILACLWRNGEGMWEGVVKDNLVTTDAKIMTSENIVLIIQNTFNSN